MRLSARKPEPMPPVAAARRPTPGRARPGAGPAQGAPRPLWLEPALRLRLAKAVDDLRCSIGSGRPGCGPNRAAWPIQARLAVSTPGDAYEQEAERFADRVMAAPASRTEGPCACGGSCPRCQAKAAGPAPLPPAVGEALRSPGQALDPATRGEMEAHLGHDFGAVRVHTGPGAAESARSIRALAYTVGHHIAFDQGRYAPGTAEGRRLLAHELVHVVQQTGPAQSGGDGPASVAQRTPAAMLQGFWVTKEPAGGCGICYSTLYGSPQAALPVVGRMAHALIQGAFVARLRSTYRLEEFSYSSPGDDNGRLDLAVATPTGFKIGEIKPATPSGEEDGVRDLAWYKTTLQAAYPNSTIEMLDVGVPGSGLEFPDVLATLAGCSLQTLGVTALRPGLYGYWCAPLFSLARRMCTCRFGGGMTVTNAEFIQNALDAAAIAARVVGDVERAEAFEATSIAIAEAIAAAVETGAGVVEDVTIGVRALQLLEAVE